MPPEALADLVQRAAQGMKHVSKLLLIEPAGHVSETEFADELAAAAADGLKVIERPLLRHCLAALFQKP